MPAYDFHCPTCDHTFEVRRSISDKSDVFCPDCGDACARVFSPVGVVFKGSGFYNTDSRPKHKESPAPAGDSCAKAGSSSSCTNCPAAQ